MTCNYYCGAVYLYLDACSFSNVRVGVRNNIILTLTESLDFAVFNRLKML